MALAFVALASLLVPAAASSAIGVNLELNEQRNRMDPDVAAQSLAALSVTKAKTFSSPASTLGAQQVDALLANGVTDLIVGAPGLLSAAEASEIAQVLQSKLAACSACTFTVAVANEPTQPNTFTALADVSVSIQTMVDALATAGIADSVSVTVPFSGSVTNGAYPPQNCVFQTQYKTDIVRIANQVQASGGTFAVNLYPWFAVPNPQIPMDYALGNPSGGVDGVAESLLDAQFICTVASLHEAGVSDTTVMVTETGWPTSGDANALASAENAEIYNTNTANWARAHGYQVYLFEMFDELLKNGGAGVEPHWGLMDESRAAKYDLAPIFDGSVTSPPSSAAPSSPPCTPLHSDPWSTGQHVPCCAGTEEVVGDWNGDGNWYYQCTASSLLSAPPPPPPASTPAPPPPPPPPPCTPADADPWSSGVHVLCCAGTEEQVNDWNGDGNWFFQCTASSQSDSPPPPQPAPPPLPSSSGSGGNVIVIAPSPSLLRQSVRARLRGGSRVEVSE